MPAIGFTLYQYQHVDCDWTMRQYGLQWALDWEQTYANLTLAHADQMSTPAARMACRAGPALADYPATLKLMIWCGGRSLVPTSHQ